MTTIKATTQRGQHFINAFNRGYVVGTIYDIYKTPSRRKFFALEGCKERYNRYNGVGGLRCLGNTSWFFTIGYKTSGGDLIIETAQNTYLVK